MTNTTNPKHYATQNGKDLFAIMKEALLTPEQYTGFLTGNVYKYLHRYKNKNGAKDLAKAGAYLTQLTHAVYNEDGINELLTAVHEQTDKLTPLSNEDYRAIMQPVYDYLDNTDLDNTDDEPQRAGVDLYPNKELPEYNKAVADECGFNRNDLLALYDLYTMIKDQPTNVANMIIETWEAVSNYNESLLLELSTGEDYETDTVYLSQLFEPEPITQVFADGKEVAVLDEPAEDYDPDAFTRRFVNMTEDELNTLSLDTVVIRDGDYIETIAERTTYVRQRFLSLSRYEQKKIIKAWELVNDGQPLLYQPEEIRLTLIEWVNNTNYDNDLLDLKLMFNSADANITQVDEFHKYLKFKIDNETHGVSIASDAINTQLSKYHVWLRGCENVEEAIKLVRNQNFDPLDNNPDFGMYMNNLIKYRRTIVGNLYDLSKYFGNGHYSYLNGITAYVPNPTSAGIKEEINEIIGELINK